MTGFGREDVDNMGASFPVNVTDCSVTVKVKVEPIVTFAAGFVPVAVDVTRTRLVTDTSITTPISSDTSIN